MRLKDSPEEAAWRQEVRDFIQREMPPELRSGGGGGGGFGGGGGAEAEAGQAGGGARRPEARAGGAGLRMATGPMAVSRKKLQDRGWIAPAWPKEYGGADLSIMQQF